MLWREATLLLQVKQGDKCCEKAAKLVFILPLNALSRLQFCVSCDDITLTLSYDTLCEKAWIWQLLVPLPLSASCGSSGEDGVPPFSCEGKKVSLRHLMGLLSWILTSLHPFRPPVSCRTGFRDCCRGGPPGFTRDSCLDRLDKKRGKKLN